MPDLLLTLSDDQALALCGIGLPVAFLAVVFAFAWAVRPGLSSGRL